MEDRNISAIAGVATVIVLAAAGIAVAALAGANDDGPRDHLADYNIIDVGLAMSTQNKKKVVLPQKQFKDPDPVKKPEGVSHDDKKQPDDKKKPEDEKKVEQDPKDLDISKFKHPSDPDVPTGPVVKPFDPNSKQSFDGLDSSTRGDPWLGAVKRDMAFQPPEIAKGNSNPVGCIHITPDGKITDTKFEVTTDDDLQTAAEAAIKRVRDLRNQHPLEVPPQLLPLTSGFLCFKFSVSG